MRYLLLRMVMLWQCKPGIDFPESKGHRLRMQEPSAHAEHDFAQGQFIDMFEPLHNRLP